MNASSLESTDRRRKILLALSLVAAALAAVAACALIAYYFDVFLKVGVAGQAFRLAVLKSVARPVAMTGCALLFFLLCCYAKKRPAVTVLPMGLYYLATAVYFLVFMGNTQPLTVAKYAAFLLFVLVYALALSGLLKEAGCWLNLILGLVCVGIRGYIFVRAILIVFGMIGAADGKTVAANAIALLPYCAELLLLAAMIFHPFVRRATAPSLPAEGEAPPEPAAHDE